MANGLLGILGHQSLQFGTARHPKTGYFIVIMQRSHERDLIGHILAKEFDGIHVCLPAQFERRHPYVYLDPKCPVPRRTDSSYGSGGGPKIGEAWHDFRTEGQPLWKSRFPENVLKRWASSMTSHAAAGQLQQRPTAREGGLFKRAWLTVVDKLPERKLERVRAWDLTSTAEGGTTSDPDYTVGVLMGRDPDTMTLYVLDVTRGRWTPGEVEEKIIQSAAVDGSDCKIQLPKDPGQAGKFQAHYLVGKLQGYSVKIEPEVGDKEKRADPLAAQAEHGFVRLLEGHWNQAFINELCGFPNAAHDDQVDAASAAFRALVRRLHYSAVSVSF